jgi:predicted amidohydrolase YtcJ
MPKSSNVLRACVFLALPAVATAQAAPPSPGPILAIEHVTVIPMDSERVLTDHTVLVEARRIAAVGPSAAVKVPDGALRIDGRGRFLIPGLAEMHGHFPSPQALQQYGEELGDRLLFLNVACGVTTVRGMIGGPRDLRVREEIRRASAWAADQRRPSINSSSVPDAASLAPRREQRAAG